MYVIAFDQTFKRQTKMGQQTNPLVSFPLNAVLAMYLVLLCRVICRLHKALYIQHF